MKKHHYGDKFSCYVVVGIGHMVKGFGSFRAADRYMMKHYPPVKYEIKSHYVGIPSVKRG